MDGLVLVDKYRFDMSVRQINKLCNMIRQSTSNKALAIYIAKLGHWWDQNNEETSKEVFHSNPDPDILQLIRNQPWWIEPL